MKPKKKYTTHTDSKITNSTGFTLIELLITTSLTVLLMLSISSMFMTFLVGNSKTNIKKLVKQEGLHAMSQIEFNIKNARYLNGSCTANMNSLSITDFDGNVIAYSLDDDDKIQAVTLAGTSVLTSSNVTANSLNFDCSGEVGNRQIITSFVISKPAPTLSEDSQVLETFTSTVNMRN